MELSWHDLPRGSIRRSVQAPELFCEQVHMKLHEDDHGKELKQCLILLLFIVIIFYPFLFSSSFVLLSIFSIFHSLYFSNFSNYFPSPLPTFLCTLFLVRLLSLLLFSLTSISALTRTKLTSTYGLFGIVFLYS